MLKVYGMSSSGNCYKVRLLLQQLQRRYEWIETDTRAGATREPAFLKLNPNGKVPTLEFEPGRCLAESNAILYFLAEDTPFWPAGRLARAQVLQWMFFEQYSHEPYIAVARFICACLPPEHPRRAELPRLHEGGYQALAVMEQQLLREPYFGGQRYSIADMALFAYTHAAADGSFDLTPFNAIKAWLTRVRAQPHFVPMPAVS